MCIIGSNNLPYLLGPEAALKSPAEQSILPHFSEVKIGEALPEEKILGANAAEIYRLPAPPASELRFRQPTPLFC